MAFTGADGEASTICLMQNMSTANGVEALMEKRWHTEARWGAWGVWGGDNAVIAASCGAKAYRRRRL